MKKIFKKWLSSYSLCYPRSIAYMLQASEYKLPVYSAWIRRVKDFRKVEVRKHFVKTPKSILILGIAWLILLVSYALALSILFSGFPLVKYFLFLLIIALTPHFLGYGIIIPLVIPKFLIQNPIEFFIIQNAREKLKKHKALRIGISGSFGKTTIREILKTVLAEGKKVAAPPENHNTLLGISGFIKALEGDEEILIFELGEYHKGDIKEMCKLVRPEIGVITGVNEAHLEKFESLETTASTIFELKEWLGGRPLYVNGESALARGSASSKNIIYTRNGTENLKIENAKSDLAGTSFTVKVEPSQECFGFRSKLLGLHHIGPLCAAIHIAWSLGITMEDIQKGVAKTKPFDHRLAPRALSGGVTLLDDSYNGNPDGVKAVIEFLASLTGRRRFYITPGLVEMGSRTEAVHREIGKNLAKAEIEKVVLIKNSVTPFIEKGLQETGYKGEVIWFEDSLKMLAALPHLTVENDVVLLQNDWPDQYC